MNKQKFLTYAVVGLMLMNIALMAFLFFRKPPPPRDKMGGRHEKPMKMMKKRLGFDAEQSVAYEQLIESHQNNIRSTEKRIRKAKDALFSSISNPNEALKDSLITKLGNLQKEIEIAHYSHFIDLKGICKPEQLDEFNEMTKRFGKIFGPRGRKHK